MGELTEKIPKVIYTNFNLNEEHLNLVEFRCGVDSQIKTTLKKQFDSKISEANYISSKSNEELTNFWEPIKRLPTQYC